MDGIGQPAVNGFVTDAVPGQALIDAGEFIVGATGDKDRSASWTTEGSFMAFRQLKQLVPEFNQYLSDNALEVEDLTKEEGAELLGARMMGRWKSVSFHTVFLPDSSVTIQSTGNTTDAGSSPR